MPRTAAWPATRAMARTSPASAITWIRWWTDFLWQLDRNNDIPAAFTLEFTDAANDRHAPDDAELAIIRHGGHKFFAVAEVAGCQLVRHRRRRDSDAV